MTATVKQGSLGQHAAGLCLTPSDLRALGKNELAYVRRYHVKGQVAYVLHAADGSAIGVRKDAAAARLCAREQDLELVSLH